jgi:transcriptional regulator with PAS, ATPase and Fis domain
MQYNWKGNVRELENVIERAVNLMEGDIITSADIPEYIIMSKGGTGKIKTKIPTLREMERVQILHALKETGGDRAKAADMLGIDKTTLWRKVKKYGIE